MKITFHGAAGTVTGSKHLIQLGNGKSILLDCGLFQGLGAEGAAMNREFGFNPEQVDYLILSHAHIDHAGLIPLLVKEGFKGDIICTPATADLCGIMLPDSGFIQEHDAQFINKRRKEKGMPPIEPLYTADDAHACLSFFKKVPYHVSYKVCEGVDLFFTDAGHIIGSAVVNLTFDIDYYKLRVCYTGDIGRHHPSIIRPPEPFPTCDVIITESTYGDKIHPPTDEVLEAFLQIVKETCEEKRGKLIIPAFSVGRTQEIIYVLDQLENQGKLPHIPVFVDSPLSVNATDIIRNHPDCYNERLHEYMTNDPDPFGFNRLHYIQHVNESKVLNERTEPCIIISASGMADAGRVKHHISNSITNPKNTILFVGHCEGGSLGARLLSGAEEVRIFGDMHPVNASVKSLGYFSAHGDRFEMRDFLLCQNPEKIKRVYVVHGEDDAREAFRGLLEESGFSKVILPQKGESFKL